MIIDKSRQNENNMASMSNNSNSQKETISLVQEHLHFNTHTDGETNNINNQNNKKRSDVQPCSLAMTINTTTIQISVNTSSGMEI